jgi:hypothetical protein
LHELRLAGNQGLNVRLHFGRVAGWVGALCGIWANCKSFLLAPRRRKIRLHNCTAYCMIRGGRPRTIRTMVTHEISSNHPTRLCSAGGLVRDFV